MRKIPKIKRIHVGTVFSNATKLTYSNETLIASLCICVYIEFESFWLL